MASTRDKRMKTDSPTPAQANEATTPTTKATTGAIKLKRMSRSRSGMLSSGKLEGEDGNDSVGLSEDTQSSTASATTSDSKDQTPKTPNTRPKRTATKDEAADSNGNAKEELKEVPATTIESPPPPPLAKRVTKSQALKNKAAEIAKARRIAMLKRTSLPIPVKASLRNLSRRTSSTTPAKTTETPSKKGKVTRKNPEKKENEVEGEDEEEQKEDEPEGDEKSEEFETPDQSDITVKQEKLEEKIDIQNVRRSTRQRKSTIKDRDSPFTRRSQTRDKSESKRDSVSPALSSASVKMEKESAKAISINVDTASTDNKDPSLSPELVSEEMDSESVQHLYDKPDFLENNLGIEKDPKLGEIVKVQEKTKVEVAVVEEAEPLLVKEEEEIDIKPDEDVEEKEEEINGSEKMEVDEAVLEEKTEEKVEVEAEKVEEEEIKEVETLPTIVDIPKPPKIEESSEENKENNVESSAKSIGSNSPRSSEDRLKIMSEGNLPKIESSEATELFKEKVNHFKSLGLLTHKAAGEAKLAKIKRKEEFAVQMAQQASRKAKYKDSSSHDQQNQASKTSGTLKTIIKLPKSDKEKRKSRMPLKMTFQKKSRDKDSNGSSNSSADTFYTIQNEVSFFELFHDKFLNFI